MRIAAVMGGAGGDATVQYVELRMDAAGQGFVSSFNITFRDAAGDPVVTFTFPGNVTGAASGSSILVATQEFADAATVTPDFIFSASNTSANMMGADVLHPVPVPAGKIAFAEGSQNCQFGGPFVVDSLAYGDAYAGSVDYGSKFPTDLPTVGTQALVVDNLNLEPTDNATEYSIEEIPVSIPPGADTPRNNAGETGTVAVSDDNDGDGLTNDDEINIHGTDSNNPDTDGDGFKDGVEVFVGTLPTVGCGAGAWPPDFNDDERVTIADVLALKPAFGSQAGDPNYDQRLDLTADGRITISDVLALKPVFGQSCT